MKRITSLFDEYTEQGRLSSMMALHARAIVADVRLERKLCFEYAKLKAKS